jgi:DMSO reductase anchor subunit
MRGIEALPGAVGRMPICETTLLLAGRGPASLGLMSAAAVLQAAGLLAERWLFFAEGRHPQNLYYQRIG